jgi:hypothetical protein
MVSWMGIFSALTTYWLYPLVCSLLTFHSSTGTSRIRKYIQFRWAFRSLWYSALDEGRQLWPEPFKQRHGKACRSDLGDWWFQVSCLCFGCSRKARRVANGTFQVPEQINIEIITWTAYSGHEYVPPFLHPILRSVAFSRNNANHPGTDRCEDIGGNIPRLAEFQAPRWGTRKF